MNGVMIMTDFETRLADALARQAERAPDAAGLAEGARRRLRRRRTATAGAAVTAVVAVTVGLSLAKGMLSIESTPGASVEPTPTGAGVPAGWRFESWRDLEFAVPGSWTYGSMGAWCASGGSLEVPRVERPGRVTPMIMCQTDGYGVRLGPAGPGGAGRAPAGAAVRTRTIDGTTLTAVTKDPAEADLIVGSLHKITGVDVSGCAPKTAVPASGTFRTPQDAAPGPVALCHYTAADGYLDQSEQLSDQDSRRTLEALRSTPAGAVPVGDCPGAAENRAIMVRTADRVIAWVYYQGCVGVHADLGDGRARQLTAELMYMVLSPGSARSFGSNVPVPSVLRGGSG